MHSDSSIPPACEPPLTPAEFAAFLNDQAQRHYPDPLVWPEIGWEADPKPCTFTIPIRTRKRSPISPGALARANPGFLRRML